jgi:hypothetical protein
LVDYTDSDEDAESSAPLTSGNTRGLSPHLRQNGALNILASDGASRTELESIPGTAVFSDDFIASGTVGQLTVSSLLPFSPSSRPAFHKPRLVRRRTPSSNCQDLIDAAEGCLLWSCEH